MISRESLEKKKGRKRPQVVKRIILMSSSDNHSTTTTSDEHSDEHSDEVINNIMENHDGEKEMYLALSRYHHDTITIPSTNSSREQYLEK